MVANRIEKVEPYNASLSQRIVRKWSGSVRAWSEPKSAVEGTEVADEIKSPAEVTVVEHQEEL